MSRPRLIPLGRYLAPGVLAVALFGVIAATVLTFDGSSPLAFTDVLADPAGFEDASVVAGIGFALIGQSAAAGTEMMYQNTENFLVALILVALLLDAALDGALMLASKEDEQ